MCVCVPYCVQAQQLNREISECIYYAALRASCQLAKEQGPYETYAGSPVSQGLLQHDMWGVKAPTDRCECAAISQHTCHCAQSP